MLAGTIVAALLLSSAPARAQGSAAGAAPVRVGGKNFTEQLILSSMTSQYLRAKGIGTELTAASAAR